MNKPKIENLTAWVTGRNLNVFQKADAVIEYNKLLDYVKELEVAINYSQCCKSDSEQLLAFAKWIQENGNHMTPKKQVEYYDIDSK